MGVAPTHLHHLRSRLATSMGMATRGRCSVSAIHIRLGPQHDPLIQVPLMVLRDYIHMYRAMTSDDRAQLEGSWAKLVRRHSPGSKWNQVHGPISATFCTLLDAGWRLLTPSIVMDHDGERFELTDEGPIDTALEHFRLRLQWCAWQCAATTKHGAGLDMIPDLASSSLH